MKRASDTDDPTVIAVRRVLPREYEAAGEVTASAWQPRGDAADPAWLRFRAHLIDVVTRDRIAAVYVAVDGRVMLGTVTLETERRITDADNPEPLGDDEAHVRLLAVIPAARHGGVGRRLMAHCAAMAGEAGKSRITLNTSPANVGAQRFYASIGYTRLPDRRAQDGSTLCVFECALGTGGTD